MPSLLRSPLVRKIGFPPVAKLDGGPKFPPPTPSNIEIVFDPRFATARSGIASPFKFSTTIEIGFVPTPIVNGDENPPEPLPNRIWILAELKFAITRSGF